MILKATELRGWLNLVPRWMFTSSGINQSFMRQEMFAMEVMKVRLKNKQTSNSFICLDSIAVGRGIMFLKNYTKDLDFNEANPPFPINLQWIRQRTVVFQPLMF